MVGVEEFEKEQSPLQGPDGGFIQQFRCSLLLGRARRFHHGIHATTRPHRYHSVRQDESLSEIPVDKPSAPVLG